MVVAASISIGTLHAIVATVLVVIGASRLVHLSRVIGRRLDGVSPGPHRRTIAAEPVNSSR